MYIHVHTMARNKQPVIEKVAKSSGNSAHVYLPTEWEEDIVRVQRIASASPPLFQTVDEGELLRVEFLGDGGEQKVIEGVVEERKLDLDSGDEVEFTVSLDVDDDEYRIEVTRPRNNPEWNDEYRVKKQVTKTYTKKDDANPVEVTDDDPESDDYVELMPTEEDDVLMSHVDWETVGVVKSLAVKQQVKS